MTNGELTLVANEPDEDKRIVAAVLSGNQQEFACLVQKYRRPLLHLAKSRLGTEDLAEDAVQDTFIAAYRSLRTYKPEFGFRTWLWTIHLNQCRRHGSRLAKLPRQNLIDVSEQTWTHASSEPQPEMTAMFVERNRLLASLLSELTEVQADAIRLRFFGHLKYREIAAAMNSSLGAAKQRVKLGLIAIGELLRDRALLDSVFPEETQ